MQVRVATLKVELKNAQEINANLKLEVSQRQLDNDVLREDLTKLIDRERNLTDRLLDRHLGSPSSPSNSVENLKPIGLRRPAWDTVAAGYESRKHEEADKARRDSEAKKAHWDKKVQEIEKLEGA